MAMATPSFGEVIEGDAILKGDKLILRGLMFHGYHGVKPEENKLGQKFLVDIDAWLDLRSAGASDNLSDTISYTDIYRLLGFGDFEYNLVLTSSQISGSANCNLC
uniref:dihydroneopterin aldolase n=1 Tax=Cannabis sativa TaxID=3483 RepID=A0ABL6WF27_CANSA